jgi:isoprene-epoxide---glutathione S-transferase
MIKMYGYIPAWGLPDVSPFVSKIDCYLRMVHLPYELVKLPQGDLANTPKGKLPVIEDDGRTISDTVFILDYLKETYGDALDAHLSRSERAVATAFSRMFDESFYWYLVQMRYRRDESFKVYDPIWVTFLDFVPPEERTRPVKSAFSTSSSGAAKVAIRRKRSKQWRVRKPRPSRTSSGRSPI